MAGRDWNCWHYLGPLSLLFAGGTYSSCLCDETVPHLEGCLSNFWSNWPLEEKLKMNLVYLEIKSTSWEISSFFGMVIMPIWTTMSDSLLRMPAARRCPRGCQNLEVERWTCRMQLGRNWKCQKNMRENASCYHLPLFFWLKWSTWRFPHSILGASKLAVVCMMLQLPFALEGPSCYTLVVWLNFSTPAQRRR